MVIAKVRNDGPNESNKKADITMLCYVCRQPAVGQCPGCKRYYCEEHENRLETVIHLDCPACAERQGKKKKGPLAILSKFSQQSIENQFRIAAIIAGIFLSLVLITIIFYPSLEERSGWAQVAIELVAFPLAIIGLYLTISEVAERRRRPFLYLEQSIRWCKALSAAIRGRPPYSGIADRSDEDNEFALDLILRNHGDQDAEYILIDLVLYMPPQFDIGHWEFHAYREGGSLVQAKDWGTFIKPEHPLLLENKDLWTYGTGTEYHFTFNGGDSFVCYASDQVVLMTAYCNYDNPPTGIVNMELSYKIHANNFVGFNESQIAIAVVDRAIPNGGPHMHPPSPGIPPDLRSDDNK